MVSFAKEQCMTTQRLARRIGVSHDTIRRWIREGLEKRKIRGKVFVSLEALDRFDPSSAGNTRAGTAKVKRCVEALDALGVNTEGITDGSQSKARA